MTNRSFGWSLVGSRSSLLGFPTLSAAQDQLFTLSIGGEGSGGYSRYFSLDGMLVVCWLAQSFRCSAIHSFPVRGIFLDYYGYGRILTLSKRRKSTSPSWGYGGKFPPWKYSSERKIFEIFAGGLVCWEYSIMRFFFRLACWEIVQWIVHLNSKSSFWAKEIFANAWNYIGQSNIYIKIKMIYIWKTNSLRKFYFAF